ncbi:MAG: hypothetical protein ACI8UO_000090 [Verrucomicrobiales bacterium]|jgi:hypothetical protein
MKTLQVLFLCFLVALFGPASAAAGSLRAGAAKVDITHPDHPAGSNPLYAKALVLSDDESGQVAVIVAVDAVAIAEIGSIKDPFLANVRARLKEEIGLDPANIMINASHCHGIVCADVEARTVAAVKEAWERLAPARAGTGAGKEDRIMENRRLILKNGKQADVRHAYSMPADEDVAAVGPIDSEIGLLRIDHEDGRPLALVYNFAVHPIQGVPGRGNTADMTGFASVVIEENLGEGAVALFIQGCAGDINPANYKAVNQLRDAEPLGNLLGLSTLRAARKIETSENVDLSMVNESLTLPRADLVERIKEMEVEVDALLESLKGTTLNLKTFVPLYMKYGVSGDFPSYYSHRYLQDEKLGKEDWKKLDDENRQNMAAYIRNIQTMEELTRKQINLALLERHHERNPDAEKTIDVEVVGLRVGDFRMVTFPGEVTVQIGLNIKGASDFEQTFVAGYTNGYIYYSPTAQQLLNRGGAQEDSDCLLAPEWQELFEAVANRVINDL